MQYGFKTWVVVVNMGCGGKQALEKVWMGGFEGYTHLQHDAIQFQNVGCGGKQA